MRELYAPFLSSTVTVSFWHFMRKLRAFVSFIFTDRALDLPNELHDCELL
jgi:hypothetical protein